MPLKLCTCMQQFQSTKLTKLTLVLPCSNLNAHLVEVGRVHLGIFVEGAIVTANRVPRRKQPADLNRCHPLRRSPLASSKSPASNASAVALRMTVHALALAWSPSPGVHDVRLLVSFEPFMHFTPSFI